MFSLVHENAYESPLQPMSHSLLLRNLRVSHVYLQTHLLEVEAVFCGFELQRGAAGVEEEFAAIAPDNPNRLARMPRLMRARAFLGGLRACRSY